jgi:hypothetical protein
VLAVAPVMQDGRLVVAVGRSAPAHVRERPAVTLVWPPSPEGDGFSLLVDGTAQVTGDAVLTVTPVSAVLHRPAPVPGSALPELDEPRRQT